MDFTRFVNAKLKGIFVATLHTQSCAKFLMDLHCLICIVIAVYWLRMIFISLFIMIQHRVKQYIEAK